MRALQEFEFDYVSGGLTTNPKEKKSWYERVWDWISGGESQPAGVQTLSGAELGQLQRDCLDHGGSVRIVQQSGSAGATFRSVGANGEAQYFTYECNQ